MKSQPQEIPTKIVQNDIDRLACELRDAYRRLALAQLRVRLLTADLREARAAVVAGLAGEWGEM